MRTVILWSGKQYPAIRLRPRSVPIARRSLQVALCSAQGPWS